MTSISVAAPGTHPGAPGEWADITPALSAPGPEARVRDAARALGVPMADLVEAFQKIAEQAATMQEAADEVYAEIHRAPKNLPHDPSLRKDRRKWGGR